MIPQPAAHPLPSFQGHRGNSKPCPPLWLHPCPEQQSHNLQQIFQGHRSLREHRGNSKPSKPPVAPPLPPEKPCFALLFAKPPFCLGVLGAGWDPWSTRNQGMIKLPRAVTHQLKTGKYFLQKPPATARTPQNSPSLIHE